MYPDKIYKLNIKYKYKINTSLVSRLLSPPTKEVGYVCLCIRSALFMAHKVFFILLKSKLIMSYSEY